MSCIPTNKLPLEKELMNLIRELIYTTKEHDSQLINNLLYVINKSILGRVYDLFINDVMNDAKSQILGRIEGFDKMQNRIFNQIWIWPTLYNESLTKRLNDETNNVDSYDKFVPKQPIILSDLSTLNIPMYIFKAKYKTVTDNGEYIKKYIMPMPKNKTFI